MRRNSVADRYRHCSFVVPLEHVHAAMDAFHPARLKHTVVPWSTFMLRAFFICTYTKNLGTAVRPA
jgi:hypothetical protein